MKVLFIGNSYTFFSDLPELFRALAEKNGKDVEVSSVTKGGWSMIKYLDLGDENSEKLNAALENAYYDAVILQDHSIMAIKTPEQFADGMTRMVERLDGKAGRVILYQTWTRKAGHKTLVENGWTREYMHEVVTSAYRGMAAELGADIALVGECFYSVSEAHPEIELYNPDGTHPSYEGSAFAAICHYRTIYGELPADCSSLNISPELVKVFKETVTAIY